MRSRMDDALEYAWKEPKAQRRRYQMRSRKTQNGSWEPAGQRRRAGFVETPAGLPDPAGGAHAALGPPELRAAAEVSLAA